jgi:DNA modification methylase
VSVVHTAGGMVVHRGDCLDVLRAMPAESVDAVVTDPPYGLAEHPRRNVERALLAWLTGDREHVPDGRGFMGRDWDKFVPPPAVWDEAFRVLKPGGHLLAFAAPRTYDLMAISIRLAGLADDAAPEIRDAITWLYGSGFPKSLDVGKAIDKAAGAEGTPGPMKRGGERLARLADGRRDGNGTWGNEVGRDPFTYIPATVDAARWDGWGTALKPASEPIVVARKPLAGTVAANVLTHGTGALNIDATRVEHASAADLAASQARNRHADFGSGDNRVYGADQPDRGNYEGSAGRWPTNVVLSHQPLLDDTGTVIGDACAGGCVPGCPVADLDAQSGASQSPATPVRQGGRKSVGGIMNATGADRNGQGVGYGDEGGASRFFPTFRYQAKAGAKERPRVLALAEWCACGHRADDHDDDGCHAEYGAADGMGPCDCQGVTDTTTERRWIAHPTVKPLALMRWLVRLVTPPGGTVLDLFAGTGTTGEAAILEGVAAVLIERDPESIPLILDRLTRRTDPVANLTAKAGRGEDVDLGLFAFLDGQEGTP